MDGMTIAPAAALEQLLAVLREGFEGPAEAWSYFTDSGGEAALFGTLDRLSAEQASQPSGPGGTTIAGQVHHLVFSLSASTDWILDRWEPRDWGESWRVTTVDEAAWAELRDALRRGYEALTDAVQARAMADEKAFGGAVGAIAHIAYHLGAIRQKLPRR
ncbi:MAG TPA: DinB family protein [Longimicrobiales bacterium]